MASAADRRTRVTGGRVLTGAGLLFVLGTDAAVVWILASLGRSGLREIGGWGMLLAGIVLLPVLAANLLVLIALLLWTQLRRIESTSE